MAREASWGSVTTIENVSPGSRSTTVRVPSTV